MAAPVTVNASGVFDATREGASIGEAVLRMETATSGSLLLAGRRLVLIGLACTVLYFVAAGLAAKLSWNPVIFKRPLTDLIGAGGAVVVVGALQSNIPLFLRGLWRGVVRLGGFSPLRRGRQFLGIAAEKAQQVGSWISNHLPWRREKVSPPAQ